MTIHEEDIKRLANEEVLEDKINDLAKTPFKEKQFRALIKSQEDALQLKNETIEHANKKQREYQQKYFQAMETIAELNAEKSQLKKDLADAGHEIRQKELHITYLENRLELFQRDLVKVD